MLGPGRVGQAVANRLRERGVEVVLGREPRLAVGCELAFVCVPDDRIAAVAALLPAGTFTVHCSGALSVTALRPHRGCALHPLTSFAPGGDAAQLDGVPAAVTEATPTPQRPATSSRGCSACAPSRSPTAPSPSTTARLPSRATTPPPCSPPRSPSPVRPASTSPARARCWRARLARARTRRRRRRRLRAHGADRARRRGDRREPPRRARACGPRARPALPRARRGHGRPARTRRRDALEDVLA